MLYVSEKLYSKLVTVFLLVLVLFAVNTHAQKKKKAQTNSKTQSNKVSLKETKLADKKNRAEQVARQAAIAEANRRRAQAAQAAQAKRRAFESSLHTQTLENISNDDSQGEDLEIRRAAISALGNHAGTVVVLEVQTGKVLAIVNQDWAIRKSFKPCSTIKLVTAIAGLSENLIGDDGNILSANFRLNLDDALAYSNNAYFQRVGINLGSTKMISYAQMLGLGTPTGINSENETGGRLPFGNNNARIYSHGDDFEVTPLQLAVLVSAISNGGKVIIPRIPRAELEKTNFPALFRREINLPKETLQGVLPGMIGAAAYGTARRGVGSSMAVAGKTGSCIGQGSWVGLFASVAPIDNPKYAVIVITRGQSERGKYAAAVAGQIYQMLRTRFTENGQKTIAKIPTELKPQSKVDAKTSAILDDAEDEDTDDSEATPVESTVRKGKKGGAESSASQQVAEKTEKPGGLFPPVIIEVKRGAGNQLKRPRVVLKQ
jgi:membrane peptidoglycan carboxypeptidase